MVSDPEFTLSQIGRILHEPQHRLIYLCEKGVVSPDFGEARGRGSSRRFSARNLLEFAIALKFRELMIPVTVIGTMLYVLREFAKRVRLEIPEFRLPHSLCEPKSPDLRIVVTDGPRLFFLLVPKHGSPKVFGGIELPHITFGAAKSGRLVKRQSTVKQVVNAKGKKVSLGKLGQTVEGIGPYGVKLEIDVSRIARNLRL